MHCQSHLIHLICIVGDIMNDVKHCHFFSNLFSYILHAINNLPYTVSHWNGWTVNADSFLLWRVIITASHHMAQRIWNIDAVCEFIGLLCALNEVVLGHWMQEITNDLSIITDACAAHTKLNATVPHAIFKLFSCSFFFFFFHFNLWEKSLYQSNIFFLNGNWPVRCSGTITSPLSSTRSFFWNP